jgi:hypothetical protein
MGSDFFKGNLARQVAILHHEIERSLAVFVLDGVLERFPQLKIVSAENDVAWVPYFMWRMDFAQDRFGRSGATPVKLSLKPSEYVKRQVYATFINEPIFIHTVSCMGRTTECGRRITPTQPRSGRAPSSSLKRLSVGFRRKTGARLCMTQRRASMGSNELNRSKTHSEGGAKYRVRSERITGGVVLRDGLCAAYSLRLRLLPHRTGATIA